MLQQPPATSNGRIPRQCPTLQKSANSLTALADESGEEEIVMIGLLADVGSIHFPDLLGVLHSGPGLSGPVGLNSNSGTDSVGLNGGLGLEFSPGSDSVGLQGGVGLFA